MTGAEVRGAIVLVVVWMLLCLLGQYWFGNTWQMLAGLIAWWIARGAGKFTELLLEDRPGR